MGSVYTRGILLSMGYVLLGIALVLNATANVALKLGSTQFAAWHDVGVVRAVLGNYALMAGVVLFACNVVFYALALSRIPLSVGYPIMVGGALIIVVLISVLYLRESVTLVQMLGLCLLVAGMVLVSYK